MDSLYEYIQTLDTNTLTAIEAGQCLLYLHHLRKNTPGLTQNDAFLKAKLKDRLLELKKLKAKH